MRVNHHRNCLLCHAPGNTGDIPSGVLNVAAPLPSDPLISPNDSGYQRSPQIPDQLVRIDMTYLRQDFSLMMRVGNASPWPDMQRFDFLVRLRVLTPKETAACQQMLQKQRAAGQLPPNHRAALYALRELTGRDMEPTSEAWRRSLKLP